MQDDYFEDLLLELLLDVAAEPRRLAVMNSADGDLLQVLDRLPGVGVGVPPSM